MSTPIPTTQDRADLAALRAYVAALPETERVAYYRANPDFTPSFTEIPAIVLWESEQLRAAGDAEGAQKMCDDAYYAIRRRRLDAEAKASEPATGDRVAGAVLGVGKLSYIPFMASLAAGALGMYPAAAALTTFAVVMGGVGVLVGYMTGGRIWER